MAGMLGVPVTFWLCSAEQFALASLVGMASISAWWRQPDDTRMPVMRMENPDYWPFEELQAMRRGVFACQRSGKISDGPPNSN